MHSVDKTDQGNMQTCMSYTDKEGCYKLQDKCQWSQVADNKPPTDDTNTDIPLFTKEFCHPIKVSDSTPAAAFDDCISKDTAALCTDAKCLWSDGTDLIPDHDFCAPADLTDDVKSIQSCIAV
jgi:hypothetical protein